MGRREKGRINYFSRAIWNKGISPFLGEEFRKDKDIWDQQVKLEEE